MTAGSIGISVLALLATTVAAGSAQGPQQPALAVFPVVFYGKGANSLEQGDSAVATMSDSILRSDLERSGKFQLLPSKRIAAAMSDTVAKGRECVSLECRRSVSQKLGAAWMVTGKLSKTSNLIWFLSGQLTQVSSGKRLLDDEFELKGIAEDIAKGGAHSLARRIVRAATSARAVDTPAGRLTLAQLRSKLDAATEDKPPDLSKADLSGLNLSGVDFKRANLA